MKWCGGPRGFTQLAQFIVTGTVMWAFIVTLACLFYLAFNGIELPPGLREVICIMVGVLAREFGSVGSKWWNQRSEPKESP